MPGDLAAQPRFASDLRKRPIAIVFEEKVQPDVGDQNIGITVAIEIGHGHSRPPIWVGQTRSRRHVFESPAAKVPVKVETSLPWGWNFSSRDLAQVVYRGTIHDEQVDPAVAVIIEPRRARTVCFGYPLLLRPAPAPLCAA